ncbi:MAG: DEAD/DEAH box helicase [Bacteroidota bacterium]
MNEEVSFEDFKLNRQLLNAVSDLGFTQPTMVQQEAIPKVLGGQDIQCIAQTGTGKTAAYLLPILMKIKYAQEMIPRALIIVPTRELAVQVLQQTQELSKYTDLRTVSVYGGVGMKSQIDAIEKGVDIVIATPGRLIDLYLANHLVLKKINTLVLDEADRLLDIGFMKQFGRILEILPLKRQNLLFSATLSEKVLKLCENFLDFPVVIRIEPEQTTAKGISQCVYHTPNLKAKTDLLEYCLNDTETFNKVIVFCRTKTVANNIFKYVTRKHGQDYARVLHSNKDQNARMNSIKDFKEGKVKVLVTTDVSARGIDIMEVSHVINFDVPTNYEEYIHRIGRTGRAFQKGDSITFCNEAEVYHITKIEKLIKKKIPIVDVPMEIKFEETPFEEKQLIAKDIDNQKRREDPDFKGAFHEKKIKKKPIKFVKRRK